MGKRLLTEPTGGKMATGGRRNPNTGRVYRGTAESSMYVYGNTARQLQTVPAERNRPVRKNHATRRNRERALHMNVGLSAFPWHGTDGSRLCTDQLFESEIRYYKQCKEYCPHGEPAEQSEAG